MDKANKIDKQIKINRQIDKSNICLTSLADLAKKGTRSPASMKILFE